MNIIAQAARNIRPMVARASCLRAFSTSPGLAMISTKDAAQLIGKPDVKFIDIRNPMQYQQGHVEGSINMLEFFSYLAMSTPQGVSHMQKTFEQLLQEKGITGKEQIICYEDSLRGMFGASPRAAYILRMLGHPNVKIMDGGWSKWQREALPAVKGEEPTLLPSDFTVNWDDAWWANQEDVEAILAGKSDSKLLDVRDKVEWDAESSSPYGVDFAPRKGRLPGAKWIEWYDFMEEAKADETDADADADDDEKFDVAKFKQPEVIQQMLADQGFSVQDDILLYCFKGARASNTLAALHSAGFNNVKIYFASWNEWSRDESLPIWKQFVDVMNPSAEQFLNETTRGAATMDAKVLIKDEIVDVNVGLQQYADDTARSGIIEDMETTDTIANEWDSTLDLCLHQFNGAQKESLIRCSS